MDLEEIINDEIDVENDLHDVINYVDGGFAKKGNLLPPPIRKFQSHEALLEGGSYRNRMKTPTDQRKRKTSSRLIECPFRIRGVKVVDGFWMLSTQVSAQNHEASEDMSGHPTFRRFSREEVTRIGEMSRSGIPPCLILASLRRANPNLMATSKSVYNTKAEIRSEYLGVRAPIQALLEELSKGGFAHSINYNMEGQLTHLFFAHPFSARLTKSYSNIFVMDCTYKTNKFKMPLLDIIGVSSFNTSFYSCFAFLSKEETEDYVWALTMFKNMLGSNEPVVIVSDREKALMNAIKLVFLKTTNLLCVWHIEKNILANCRGHFEKEDEDGWNTFLSGWTAVIESDSPIAYNEVWEAFETSYKDKVVAINYIKSTWLPLKNCFMKAWTEGYMHLGNRVTSRAEGAHAVLKRYLQVSTNDLQVVTEKICLAVENNFYEIKTQLAREKLLFPHSIGIPFFKELVYCVSVFALDKLVKQYKLALSDSLSPVCKGHFVATMGLPCAHMMRTMQNRGLHLSDIHSQWRIDKLSFDDNNCCSSNESGKLKMLFQALENNYEQWDIGQKEATEKQLSQLIHAPLPVVFDPIVQPRRGRPLKSKKKSTSTLRDPSAFEIVQKSNHCSKCGGVGHNSRTCSRVSAASSDASYAVSNVFDSGNSLFSLDLNSLPNTISHQPWQ